MQEPNALEITNQSGLRARFSRLGARWTHMYVPDQQGEFADVLLGFTADDDYRHAEEKYYGAVVGRYCGRIPHGTFYDHEKQIKLPLNDHGKHHLHGGVDAFHLKEWELIPELVTENCIALSLSSADGEQGYPGDLRVTVTYTLSDDNRLVFEVSAQTNRKTLVNVTNHAFFNLTGRAFDLVQHKLVISGDQLVQDEEFLLTGGVIGYDQAAEVPLKGQVSSAYRLKDTGNAPQLTLREPTSGRFLKMYTNQPAVQLYNGFFMSGADRGKNGAVHQANTGLAIEPQHLAYGHLNVLRPNEIYKHLTTYQFGADRQFTDV
ncbi:MAG: aldose epimerase family protein [Tunicatimonas sp.]